MKKIFAAALMCAASLSNAYASDIAERAAALLKASPDKEYVIMTIPAGDNFISNKLIVASLKSGTESLSVREIVAMLQRPAPVKIAITGENDSITVATLDRAFESLKGKTVAPHELAYVGNADAASDLAAKAAAIGVKLVVVPFH